MAEPVGPDHRRSLILLEHMFKRHSILASLAGRQRLGEEARAAPTLLAVLMAVLLATQIGFAHAVPARQTSPAFKSEACAAMLDVASSNIDENMECGWLTVPVEHSKPDGDTIELGVVILYANTREAAQEPLFMAQGGPGGSTIDSYLPTMPKSPIRDQHDIVLFDQRGTKHTRPDLQCTEYNDLLVKTIELDLPDEQTEQMNADAAQACKTRLQGAGAKLAAYDSMENAADVNALREALGYNKISLYGVSYGTLLAQHVMRDFPGILSAVVLDGVVAPRQSFVAESGRSENNALTQLFQACAADVKCNGAYPNLEKTLYDTSARLNAASARVRMSDLETGKSYNAVVDGDTLQGFVFQGLYATDLLPYLPYMIAEASKGNYGPLGNVASLFVFDRSVSYGMYYSVMCAEDGNFDPGAIDTGDLRPEIAERNKRDLKSLKDVCNVWNVDLLPATADEPVTSDVPTLLLSGRFDPITPATNAQDVARTLSKATAFVFPNTGHGAFQSERCATRIVQAFLNSPAVKPDGSCIGALQPPAFKTRADFVPVPALPNLLSLNESVRLPGTAFILGLLALTTCLSIPISWLARKLSKRTYGELPSAAKGMPWLTLLNWLVLTAFLAGLATAALQLVDANNYLFLFGLPSSQLWLFTLPVAALVMTVLIVVGTLAGLRSAGWGALRKIHRGLLALASVVCVVALAALGMLVTPFF